MSITTAAQAADYWVYFGAYTGPKSKGIYVSRMNADTGKVSPARLAAETARPSFLAIHPNLRFLYAVGETAMHEGKRAGSLHAFAMDRATGNLTRLNDASSGGPGPCHLIVDKAGASLLVANYSGGSAAVIRIESDGRLGKQTAFVQHAGSSVNPRRQQGPHAHSIHLDAANRFAFVADLGLDKVVVYRFDPAAGTLEANDPPAVSVHPGAGPRHFAFHPSGKFAYVIDELDSTITAFAYHAGAGALDVIQTVSTLPEGFDGDTTAAEVQVHPSGRFLYGSNRGHDSIAVFRIDEATGKLTPVEYEPTQGKTPRHFGIDPTGRFLLAANQNSDNVVVFRINGDTGALQPTGQTLDAPACVCVKFVPVE